ncbi:MAG: hypothetical protein C0485_00305 [Pirellula sp.]|nr:hypothetical protein [Pirellula sp.]
MRQPPSINSAVSGIAPISAPGRPAPGARLLLALVAIATIWLVILPALAQVSTVRTMIDRHEAHGVDPSAKFYSELPAMPMISQRVDEIRRAEPAAFGLRQP